MKFLGHTSQRAIQQHGEGFTLEAEPPGFNCKVITCSDLGQISQPFRAEFPYLENGDNHIDPED